MKVDDFKIGDRITFTERVFPKTPHGFRTHPETGKNIATPEVQKQIVPQTGEGTVTRGVREERVNGRKVRTVKVRALGFANEIIVVADDAVLTAAPMTLDFGFDEVADTGPSMYGQDVRGGA